MSEGNVKGKCTTIIGEAGGRPTRLAAETGSSRSMS